MTEYELNALIDKVSAGDVEALVTLIDYYLSIGETKKAELEAERLKYIHHYLAYRKLANLAFLGTFNKPDYELSKEYYQKAFDMGDNVSGYNLALLLTKENNSEEALKYLTDGVSKDYIPSLKLLASLYLKGDGVTKDLTISLSLLQKAQELGDDSVITSIGKIHYLMGDFEEAFNCFSLGAAQKDKDAIYHLGLCYAKGLGVNQDLNKSRFYYEMGANLNEPNCLYDLSVYYRNGISVEQNTDLADTLLEQAIKNGFKK